MPLELLAWAVLTALAPPLLMFMILRGRPRSGRLALGGAAALAAGFALYTLTARRAAALLGELRAAWLDHGPHDWAGLDADGRAAVLDGIATRLSHGKLVAQAPEAAVALGLAGAALLLLRASYQLWQIRRAPSLDG